MPVCLIDWRSPNASALIDWLLLQPYTHRAIIYDLFFSSLDSWDHYSSHNNVRFLFCSLSPRSCVVSFISSAAFFVAVISVKKLEGKLKINIRLHCDDFFPFGVSQMCNRRFYSKHWAIYLTVVFDWLIKNTLLLGKEKKNGLTRTHTHSNWEMKTKSMNYISAFFSRHACSAWCRFGTYVSHSAMCGRNDFPFDICF